MDINIEFVDEHTVKIEATMDFYSLRPAPELRRQVLRSQIVDAFKERHPSYSVGQVEGPSKISNFRKVENSFGSWTLKVAKKDTRPITDKKEKTKPHRPTAKRKSREGA